MARMQADVLEEFLLRRIIAVPSPLRRDGRPYQIPWWSLWTPGVSWTPGTYTPVWCKHIFHDGRVSLCIEATDPVARYVAVDCTADPVEPKDTDIWPVSRLLAEKYVGGAGGNVDAFIANMQTEP